MTVSKLQRFQLRSFKAVRDTGSLRLGPLTVFIGNNGSGKSSVVEGLETFRAIVLDGLDAAMVPWRGFEEVRNKALPHQVRAGFVVREAESNPMQFDAALKVGRETIRVMQRIGLGAGGNKLFIDQEQVTVSAREGSRRWSRGSDGKVVETSPRHARPRRLPEQLDDGVSFLRGHLQDTLSRWQFLALAPEAMGQPYPQQRAAGRVKLHKTGANLAEYLNDIRELDVNAFDDIVDGLRFVLPYAADLQPVLASELGRAFFLKMNEGGFSVPGWLLSTGTLRILALLACLRHPQPPPLLVVEEVENGLDPRTMHLLVEEFRAAIDVGKTQIVLTTHSPYLLDLLDLSHIVVVEREEGQPVFRRPDAEQLRNWSKSFSPGMLYTMGRLTKGDQE